MKKQVLFIVAVLWGACAMATVRTPKEAAEIAGRFAATKGQNIANRMTGVQRGGATALPMTLAYTQNTADGEVPALYIFNAAQGGGFVVVSATEKARTILGYSDHDTVDGEKMPANLRFWLQMYADEIARAENYTDDYPQTAETEANAYPEIAPLLGDIQWGQDAPYNDSCPKPQGYDCPTGCAATAIAQIMRHHKYPAKGTGSHSYSYRLIVDTNDTLTMTPSADFGNATYDWDNMLPSYQGVTYTDAQSAAVARLMYHIGVSCNMLYGSESSASGIVAAKSMQTYFGYDAGMEALYKNSMSETELLGRISTELQANRPMLTMGYTIKGEGHAFVIDGMKSNGFVHINWGWDGAWDDYFAVSAFDPMGQGTGGAASGYAFTENVTVIAGIRPDKGGTGIPQVSADSVFVSSKPRIKKGKEYTTFGISYLTNTGLSEITDMTLVMAVYKDGAIQQTLPQYTISLGLGYYYNGVVSVNESFGAVPVGTYEVAAGIVYGSLNTYAPVRCDNVHGEKRFSLTVTADSVFVGESPDATTAIPAAAKNISRISAVGHTITMEADEASDMSITDAMGRLLAAEEQTTCLRLQAVPNGVYIVRCGNTIQKVLLKD